MQGQRDFIAYATIIVIVTSVLYFFVVFGSEILGAIRSNRLQRIERSAGKGGKLRAARDSRRVVSRSCDTLQAPLLHNPLVQQSRHTCHVCKPLSPCPSQQVTWTRRSVATPSALWACLPCPCTPPTGRARTHTNMAREAHVRHAMRHSVLAVHTD